MIGVYDFCGHYDWTFEWLRQTGGETFVRQYWDEGIHRDAQQHASKLIQQQGLAGMAGYWGHTLSHECADYHTTVAGGVFRIDMHTCPSKGFLLRNHLGAYHDYCDHCMGWIGPMLKRAGFVVNHEHNHCGQCWWEMRRANDSTLPGGPRTEADSQDVRLRPDWNQPGIKHDLYHNSNDPDDKV